ncbi:MAG: hypothetical protein H6705_07485 [Myxococcales bacterium]|nr:hypothetical protein [Myxococcales bacterium]
MRSIVWLSWVAGAVVMAGCLGSPAERTCADFPRDTPECADYWAGEGDAGAPDGVMDRGVVADAGDEDAAADAVVDAAADAVVDAAADAAADAGGACTPGAVEACAADGFCEGRRVCGEDRVWSACVPGDPVDEACNGRDDDCDGEVDELVDRPCGIDTGACSAGVERCAEGRWLCEGAVAPAEAAGCDGAVDEDCDGSVDEGCPCTEGTVEPCGESAVGACALGERACTAAGWGACVGAVGPGAEGCNGEDDDCDGVIDEGLARAGGSGVGAGARGEQVCAGGVGGVRG